MKFAIESKQLKVDSLEDPLVAGLTDKLADPALQTLALRGNSYSKRFWQEFKPLLSGAKGLSVLDINDIFVGRLKDEIPDSIMEIAVGLRCINIIQLDISNNAVNPFGAKALSHFLSAPNSLQTLLINNCGLGIDGVNEITLGLAQGTHQLQVLSIGRNRAENTGAQLIAKALPYLPRLRELYVFQNNIRKEGVTALLPALSLNCKQLKTLDLQDNFIEESCVGMLADLIKSSSLQSLNVSDCNVKQECNDEVITAIQSSKTLKRLGYSYNQLNQEQALKLGKAMAALGCTRLDLKGNELKKKTKAELRQLIQGQLILASDDEEDQLSAAFSAMKLSA